MMRTKEKAEKLTELLFSKKKIRASRNERARYLRHHGVCFSYNVLHPQFSGCSDRFLPEPDRPQSSGVRRCKASVPVPRSFSISFGSYIHPSELFTLSHIVSPSRQQGHERLCSNQPISFRLSFIMFHTRSSQSSLLNEQRILVEAMHIPVSDLP